MDRRLLWHWTSDLFKLNFLVHNPPPCKNQKQKSQTKGSLKREFIVVGSGCRRGAASHWNKKEKLWAALPRPRLGTVWSVDSGDDCDYVPRLAGAGLRVTAQREHRAVPLHTFTLWWRLWGYRVATPRPSSPRPAYHISLVSWTWALSM